tara:strand:+ start:1851 stop:3041 length:1191 start_codon:yes stop_codon:yes gene_type:complete
MADKFQYTYSDPTISTNASGSTPYGIYDSDSTFATESINVCKFVARRLGHPVMQLEFDSGSIYAMFEESVSEYSLHVNNYNIKNWMWNQYGSDAKITGSLGTGTLQTQHPNMGTSIVLSEQYGQAAVIGGNVNLYSGSITLSKDVQEYNLQEIYSSSLATAGSENKRISVQRVYNYGPSAITRFYDPFVGAYDQRMMLDEFGMSSYAPAATFMMSPIYYDILRANSIETSDKIRRSNYSFEINNNKVKIFPRPSDNDDGLKVWFEYQIKDELNSTTRDYTSNGISDPSNVPYKFIEYQSINAPGRQWIRKYTLALSKELLGIIRSKYASMPIPNGDVTLDGEGLKAEGREEKQQLLDELKEFLESVSLTEKTKAEAEEAEANQQVLNKAPLNIYIG